MGLRRLRLHLDYLHEDRCKVKINISRTLTSASTRTKIIARISSGTCIVRSGPDFSSTSPDHRFRFERRCKEFAEAPFFFSELAVIFLNAPAAHLIDDAILLSTSSVRELSLTAALSPVAAAGALLLLEAATEALLWDAPILRARLLPARCCCLSTQAGWVVSVKKIRDCFLKKYKCFPSLPSRMNFS